MQRFIVKIMDDIVKNLILAERLHEGYCYSLRLSFENNSTFEKELSGGREFTLQNPALRSVGFKFLKMFKLFRKVGDEFEYE